MGRDGKSETDSSALRTEPLLFGWSNDLLLVSLRETNEAQGQLATSLGLGELCVCVPTCRQLVCPCVANT
jgi:hypothetical protein